MSTASPDAACRTSKPSASSCTRIRSAALKSSSTTSAVGDPGGSDGADITGSLGGPNTLSVVVRSGSHTMKHEPSPAALPTATVPPCSSASSFTIASPSPVPSNFRDRPLSIWLKGLNKPASPSEEMPRPVSPTLISRNSVNSLSASGKLRPSHGFGTRPTCAREVRRARSVTLPPSEVNLTALARRL